MRKQLRHWLQNIPITDPVEKRQGILVQVILLGLCGILLFSALLTLIAFPFTSGAIAAANLRNTISNGISTLFVLVPLLLLRRGAFRSSVAILMIELFLIAFTTIQSLGLERGWIGALEFALPMSLAALALGRRWLIGIYVASVLGVGAIAITQYPMSGLPQNAPSAIIVFALIAGLLALFLDRFGSTFRESLLALRTSERRTRQIIETALDAVVMIDANGVITGWNPQAEAIFGWTTSEALGRSLAETIVPEHFRTAHQQGMQRYLATGEARVLNQRIELTALHRDGHEFPIELAITTLHMDGAPAFSAFVRDITERRHAEEQIHIQLRRHDLLNQITRSIGERQDLASIFQVVIRSLEDHMPLDLCCVVLYDAADSAFHVSSVGRQSDALAISLAAPAHARIPTDDPVFARCLRGHVINEQDLREAPSAWLQHLMQGGLHAAVITPLVVESHIFGGLVAARRSVRSFQQRDTEFLRQVSEHVALAAHQAELYHALQEAYDDLRQTQQAVLQQERLRALGQMASGIAHDINNAISPIGIYAELLLESETGLSERSRSWLEIIIRASSDVAATVARLREFYAQRVPTVDLVPVSMNHMVQQVIDLTRARWGELARQHDTMITVRTDLAVDLPMVMGVESEIREALTNLVFNAIDAMPQGGTLTLRTSSLTTVAGTHEHPAIWCVEVAVIDTGEGMDEVTRRRCLEPFFTTKGERGTGMGLAMVYGVAQRHSADVEIESALGGGTTISLRFPGVPSDAGAVNVQQMASLVLSRLRILLVDDDPLLLQSLRDSLEGDGHIVTIAHGGQEGIDTFLAARVQGDPFATVITDLGMPMVNGRQVARTIKEVSPKTPVLLLTGWGERLVADGEIPPFVDQVLSKPPKLRQLREALVQTRQQVVP